VIVVDADVLGRGRTGEETYISNLLREFPAVAPDLQFAAVTRHAELVPAGVEAISLPARFQEVRMAASLPRLLRRLAPQLAHFQHALPLGYGGRSVVTLHDLHFERDPSVMGLVDRLTFRTMVPRSARKADHVLAVSERTKRDAVELYGLDPDGVTVTPLAVDPAFTPGDGTHDGFLLFVGAVQARKDPLAALGAAQAAGLPLVVAGPEKDQALAAELRRRGADVRGAVPKAELAELYRRAAAVLLLSRFEGFGIPVLEAMASGTPVIASRLDGVPEVVRDGETGFLVTPGDVGELRDRIAQLLGNRALAARMGARGRDVVLEQFTWDACARRCLAAYDELLAPDGEQGGPQAGAV
jgi:glycosyltransferase involved in cell wall biosynthesis